MFVKQGFSLCILMMVINRVSAAFWETVGKFSETVSVPQNASITLQARTRPTTPRQSAYTRSCTRKCYFSLLPLPADFRFIVKRRPERSVSRCIERTEKAQLLLELRPKSEKWKVVLKTWTFYNSYHKNSAWLTEIENPSLQIFFKGHLAFQLDTHNNTTWNQTPAMRCSIKVGHRVCILKIVCQYFEQLTDAKYLCWF